MEAQPEVIVETQESRVGQLEEAKLLAAYHLAYDVKDYLVSAGVPSQDPRYMIYEALGKLEDALHALGVDFERRWDA